MDQDRLKILEEKLKKCVMFKYIIHLIYERLNRFIDIYFILYYYIFMYMMSI